MEDKELLSFVERSLENYIRQHKEKYNGRYPSSRILAAVAIDAVTSVYSERLTERLLGPDKEDEEH